MNFSPITNELFIGTTPYVSDYDRLRELGIRIIINMRYLRAPDPDPHPNPLRLIWLPTIDSPLFPIPIQKLILGARAALETIQQGGKVYTHCEHGKHRAAAMGAAVLIAQGHDAFDAMRLIKERRRVSNPYAFHIRRRILHFAQQWDTDKKGQNDSSVPSAEQ